jgi:hypothetical protein
VYPVGRVELYYHCPLYTFWCDASVKHRDNFTFMDFVMNTANKVTTYK